MQEDFIHVAASVIMHSAFDGRVETEVRAYRIDRPDPEATHQTKVRIVFIPKGKRRLNSFEVVQDNLRYATIAVNGEVVYDTRRDVPVNMLVWRTARKAFSDTLRAMRAVIDGAMPDRMEGFKVIRIAEKAL
jgi:hypothetical protein